MQEVIPMEITTDDAMRGMFMSFRVYDEDYCIEIRYVTEIVEMQDITPIPNTRHYVKGIINLRGTIVPVIDMSVRFGHPEIQYTDRTCIIVLSMDDVDIGLIIDEVQEVVEISDENIQPPPRSTANDSIKNSFIKAIGLSGEAVKQLLDINKIFEVEDSLLK